MFPAITVCNQNRIMKSLLPGTRFESLPAIDKNFCACRFVGGLNGDHLGAYSSFEGSPASQGKLQFDMWGTEPSDRYDWNGLKNY